MSVIIPTVLRPELARAVRSVSAQRLVPAPEVVVVVDGPERPRTEVSPGLPAEVKVIFTGGGRGAAFARNLGVAASTGAWVAFLDDDDEWNPEKLQLQLQRACAGGELTIVSGRVEAASRDGSERSAPIPRLTLHDGLPVEDFLFRRRAPHPGRASLFTSTLLCSASLARRVEWDPTLRRHQDWDWILRAVRDAGATVVQVPEVVCTIHVGSEGSISATANWADSLAWATRWRTEWKVGTYVDFLVAQSLRYALLARSGPGVRKVLAEVASTRRLPSVPAVLVGLAGLAPRSAVERLLTAAPQQVSESVSRFVGARGQGRR